MISQINFTISKESEKALFSFVGDECGCRILLTESSTGDFVFGDDCDITSDKYLITPLPANYEFKTERRQSNLLSSEVWVIYPFDKNYDFLPFVEYERDLFSNNTDMFCRLCMRSFSISSQYKKEMNLLFRKIKKWVKDNSSKKATIEGLVVYEVK